MNRRDFFKLLTATPAAFLVSKYGMPAGGKTPTLRQYDPAAITLTWMGMPLPEAGFIIDGGQWVRVEIDDRDYDEGPGHLALAVKND